MTELAGELTMKMAEEPKTDLAGRVRVMKSSRYCLGSLGSARTRALVACVLCQLTRGLIRWVVMRWAAVAWVW
jgi:hypothetical protein